MAAWLEPEDVAVLIQTDLSDDPWIEGVIAHAQSLVEGEVGEQDESDLPAGLVAITTQIAARLWRAGRAANVNPAGNTQETLGPHSVTAGNFDAGWGLTRREQEQLGKFRSPLWVQPTHAADALETPAGLLADTAGGDPILYFHEDEA